LGLLLSSIFRILGRKGVIEIMENLGKRGEGLKYKEIEAMVGNPSTASRNLMELEAYGIVKRRVSNEKYRPVYYALTEEGKELLSMVREIKEKYSR
jgi:DNA-binding HxlR family transcriptional regulator